MADMDRLLEAQMLCQRREIRSVVIHVMAGGNLGGTAMPAPVMGDDAKSLVQEEHHLCVPIVRRQWPAVRKHHRLARTPVLVENLNAVLGLDGAHGVTPCVVGFGKLRLARRQAKPVLETGGAE